MQLAKHFVHKTGSGKNVLISDAGNIAELSGSELLELESGKIGEKLQKKLEEKKIAITPQNKSLLQEDYAKMFSHLSEGISLHIINPSMKCNQSCLYCYACSPSLNAKGHEMSLETAKKTVDFIWQSPKKGFVIEFQGGEPLSAFSTIQFIVDYAKKKKPRKKVHWRIVSNLSLMDSTIALWLKKQGITDVCTSLDGPKQVHDKNRPFHGGSHSKTVYWINSLRNEYGFERIGALCTVTKHSLPFAEEIVQHYISLGLPDITPVPVREIGRAKQNWEKIGYKPKDYVEFWKAVLSQCIKSTNSGRPLSEQFSLMIAQKLLGQKRAFHACFSKPCGAALMQASYQPDGSIYTCDEGKAEPIFNIGSVSQPYKEVFASPNALNMVALSSSLGLLCNECKWNPFCSFCPVMAYSSQGSLVPLLHDNMDCAIRKHQFPHVLELLSSKDRVVLMKWLGPCKDL